jgi:hypothetical protein
VMKYIFLKGNSAKSVWCYVGYIRW